MKESIQKLSHIEHILKRPDSYVGPVEVTPEPTGLLINMEKSLKKGILQIFPRSSQDFGRNTRECG